MYTFLSSSGKRENNSSDSYASVLKSHRYRAFDFLAVQVMKETQGKADPEVVNKLLKAKLT